jgi:hypothetical protein
VQRVFRRGGFERVATATAPLQNALRRSCRKKETTYPVTLDAHKFIRRFLLHVLPPRFVKIRFYGFLSHTNKKAALKTIRTALHVEPPPAPPEETTAEKIERITGIDITHCPKCHGVLIQAALPQHPP